MMNLKNKIAILFLIPLFLFSCKKKEIEEMPVGNEPVFVAQGTLGGEAFSLVAGEENAYMYAYTENVNGVKKFTGKLSDSYTEIEFGVFDGNLDSDPLLLINELTDTLVWATNSSQPLAVLSKNSFVNADKINSIEWYSDNEYIGPNTVTITEPGKYNICAFVTFTDASQEHLCNEIILGYETNANFTLRYSLFPNGDLNSWIDVDEGQVASVEWDIDNETISDTDANVTVNIESESYQVTATVYFTNGVIRTKSFLIDGSLNGNNIQDFSVFELDALNKQSIKRDYNALLVLKKNNIEYRSDYEGNQSGSVIIKGVEYYGLNSQAKKVYKLKATISCTLKNMNNGSLVPVNFDTTFGVEIP